jgi:hypothetical protein
VTTIVSAAFGGGGSSATRRQNARSGNIGAILCEGYIHNRRPNLLNRAQLYPGGVTLAA